MGPIPAAWGQADAFPSLTYLFLSNNPLGGAGRTWAMRGLAGAGGLSLPLINRQLQKHASVVIGT